MWAIGQLGTGALSDRIGRKWLIVAGQLTEAVGLIAFGDGTAAWATGSAIFGAGLAGVLADGFGVVTALVVVAAITAASGVDVAIRMYETRATSSPSAVSSE